MEKIRENRYFEDSLTQYDSLSGKWKIILITAKKSHPQIQRETTQNTEDKYFSNRPTLLDSGRIDGKKAQLQILISL